MAKVQVGFEEYEAAVFIRYTRKDGSTFETETNINPAFVLQLAGMDGHNPKVTTV